MADPSPALLASPRPAMPSTDVERVLRDGFGGLRFPQWLETLYLDDKAAERLKLIRMGTLLMTALSIGLLMSDWLMVPDQVILAMGLRLLVFAPLALILLMSLPRLSGPAREASTLVMSLMAALITLMLCLRSDDELAATYVVSLALIQLFNGGVVRMRFWMAVCVDALVLAMFAGVLYVLRDLSGAVTTSMTMVVVSSTVFTLYASYWLEHRERRNWLLLQHEHLLLSELQEGNRQLDRISRLDPLTELANRRHFDEFLLQVWARGRQDGHEVSLLMIDVDHFKLYNDHYGHPAGDACLQQVAAALKRHLRKPGDLVARLGGEEFIAVLNATSLTLAQATAERVREQILQLGLPHAASPSSRQVTVSIGVACASPAEPGATPLTLIEAVDRALYDAKSAGRNRVAVTPHSH
ncbi:MAG: GGDEF domain-containing protein [Rubrivivax sp.]|nr:MAG: GGDEF domain-containing protein [Rubrivivax sp.]